MKKTIFFFAALAALFSCAKETPIIDTPAEETFSVELFASAPSEDAETKTTLVDGVDPDEGKPMKLVHWSKGDAIKVLFFPDHTNTNTFNGPGSEFQSDFETETSENAYFKTNSWSWGFGSDVVSNRLMANGIAVYPSTAEATSNKTQSGSGSANETELSFTLPDAQKAINGNIESGLNFSYVFVDRDGFKSAIDNNSAMNLKFNNSCALISLTMPTSFEKDVTSVTISSNNEVALTGKGNVDMNYYKDEFVSPFHVTPEVSVTSHTVTLAKADGSALEAGATYFAVVWPGAHEGLTISFNAADGTVATKSTKAVILTASEVKPYTFSSALNFETPGPKEYDYIYADGSMGNDVRNDIVGVVIFHGNPKTKFNDSQLPDQFCNGLAISISSRKCAWNSTQLSSIPASVKLSGATSVIADFSMGGYTATQAFGTNNYTVFANGTAPSGTSGWYLGAANEWKYILANMGKINKLLEGVGDAINPSQKSEAFWLPYFYSTRAAIVYISGGAPFFNYEQYYYYPTYDSYCYNARPIFAF